MPDTAELQHFIEDLHRRFKDNHDGQVATYIPELGKANPDDFGICLTTMDGQVLTVGDCDKEFTIQSICKPFAFQMALEQLGRAEVFKHVSVEPSGEAFNSIELEPLSKRPYNPMVNAGAITVASLIKGAGKEAGVQAFIDQMSRAAGHPLRLDESVYASESATGNRNRAIAYLLLNWGMVDADVDHALHQYFAQCSLLVNCRDLAFMAATLANAGANPVTHEEVFDVKYLKDILAVMFTCGLYDYAGEWAYHVGLPAKSGVGGGILGVVNRQLGIAVYSPRLDSRGNSVRGIQVCKALSDEFGLHVFDVMNYGSHFMRSVI